MFKKWFTRLIRVGICFILCVVVLDAGLHILSRTEWFKTRITQAVQETLGREVQLGQMGANLRGVFIENVLVAEQGGFEKGTFVEAGQVRIQFSLLHLLHGHVKVDFVLLSDATIRMVVTPDGQGSWQDLLASSEQKMAEEEKKDPFALHVTATHIRFNNTRFVYMDQTGPHTVDVNGLTLGVGRFSLQDPFSFYVQTKIYPTFQGKTWDLSLLLRGKMDLKGLELSQAFVEIESLSVSCQKASILLKGRVENLENPQVDVQAQLYHLSSEMFAEWMDLPAFDLEKGTIRIKMGANLEKSALTLHSLAVQAPGVDVHAKGGLLYGNSHQIEYDLSADGNVALGEAGRWFTALAEPYQLVGKIAVQAQATQKQITGIAKLEEVGGKFPQVGNVSNLNTSLNFQEDMNFKKGDASFKLTGKLNGSPFTISLQARQQPDLLDIQTHVQAEEILLPHLSADSTQESPADKNTEPNGTSSVWPLPPVQIKADLSVGKLDVPYFYGTDVVFKADMQGLEPGFKQAHGSLHLSTGEGKIQDLYKLTDANPLTKVLFLSLNLTGKVFNSLDVFGVLGSIGEGLASVVTGGAEEQQTVRTQTVLGPDGEPLEVPVVPTDQKVEGELSYDKFVTSVNFVRGLATIKKGSFVSSMMSFRLDGTMDFNTQKVNLTVHASPGKHEVDGMMPLTLKIGGTIDEPQGSMQLLGSVTSLVRQSVTNNAVSRQVGKVVKGIMNLFKKKNKEETVPAELAEESAENTLQEHSH